MVDPLNARESREPWPSDFYRYHGEFLLTVVTGGAWLLVRRWWRRRERNNRAWVIGLAVLYVVILVLAWVLA